MTVRLAAFPRGSASLAWLVPVFLLAGAERGKLRRKLGRTARGEELGRTARAEG